LKARVGKARAECNPVMTDRSPTADDAVRASELPQNPAAAPTAPPETAPPDTRVKDAVIAPPVGAAGAPPAPPVRAQAVVPIVTDDEPDDPGNDWWLHLPSWLASMVVHMTIVLLLALVTFSQQGTGGLSDLLVSVNQVDSHGALEELQSQAMEAADPIEATAPELPAADMTDSSKLADLAGPIGLERPGPPPGSGEPLLPSGGGDGGSQMEIGASPLELRLNGPSREQRLIDGGGTKGSEEAVQKALYWLSEHQNYDGSWTFSHEKAPRCHGSCEDPGSTPGKIAATAMALLPFLGTGQTHLEGQYKRNIELGLRFLVRSMRIQGDLGSLYEDSGGQMYGHGLAMIALCEAYGMTHDQFLREPAQAGINFIAEAQDPIGGGWRYMPRQTGDTSVVGWQLMALKSAEMAYLKVPPATVRKAGYFLDSVQSDRGSIYGYLRPERGRPATTAIGLLCRMYLGWKRDNAALQNGVRILSAMGPSIDSTPMQDNMYYNYYATQVMHHYGGSEWRRWNQVMREYLIKTQARHGHETGSWYFDGSDLGSPAGGRLYCTSMAAMTLEVYYRHMPLYRPQSTELESVQK
jgi:hypothetical protein